MNLLRPALFVNVLITCQEKNTGFVKKLIDSRALFSGVNPYERYKEACLSFAEQISYGLRKEI